MCCVKIDSISYFEIQEETESENTVLQDDDNDEEPYSEDDMRPFLDFVAPMSLNDLRAAEKQRLAVGGGYKSECRSDRRYCAAGGSASRPYGQAYSEIEELLRFAQTNSRQQCYQLFARLVKLARANGDDTNANALIGQALDFYADRHTRQDPASGIRD